MSLSVKDFSKNLLETCLSTTKRLEEFLDPVNVHSETLKKSIKSIYDLLKRDNTLHQGNGLPELIIDNFGHEEIWSQLELENDPLYFRFVTDISKIIAGKSKLCYSDNDSALSADELSEDEKIIESELQICNDSGDNEINNSKEDDSQSNFSFQNQSENTENVNNSELKDEDQFFNLKEMENFLNAEDRKELKKSKTKHSFSGADSDEESSIDYFAETDDENEENDVRYKHFFDTPGEKQATKLTGEEGSDDSDSNDLENANTIVKSDEETTKENNVKSSLELREERLKKKIGHLEKSALEDKKWQLKGEISADSRPQNSLLEEILDFDVTTRPHIVVTEQTNMQLEDIIIQRIKDKAWDSVQRKAKPVDEPLEFKKKLALDSEKSKESLAQIYEKEYIKQREALNSETRDKPEEESAEEIKTTAMINNLFSKLDALSHFYFTPRLVRPEVKIVSNLPAINMEEVAPVAVTDAALLAPEEVYAKRKGEPMAKAERTSTDKKRQLRAKKLKQRKRQLRDEANHLDEPKSKKQAKLANTKLLKQVTADRNISLMKTSGNSVGKSSEKFFNYLQDTIKTQINNKVDNSERKKKEKKYVNAKKFKL